MSSESLGRSLRRHGINASAVNVYRAISALGAQQLVDPHYILSNSQAVRRFGTALAIAERLSGRKTSKYSVSARISATVQSKTEIGASQWKIREGKWRRYLAQIIRFLKEAGGNEHDWFLWFMNKNYELATITPLEVLLGTHPERALRAAEARADIGR